MSIFGSLAQCGHAGHIGHATAPPVNKPCPANGNRVVGSERVATVVPPIERTLKKFGGLHSRWLRMVGRRSLVFGGVLG